MAVTAIVLLVIARLWLLFDSTVQLPLVVQPTAIGLGLAVGAGISLGSAGIYQLWPAYRRSADFYLRFVLAPLLPADVLWMGLLPGLSEELLFRGVMLPAIGLNITGVVVSSLCFGVLHMTGWRQWPYVVWATAIGLVLALSALMTGNLLVPVVAHIATNSASSLIWKLQAREKSG